MSTIPDNLPEGTTHFCPSFGRYPKRAFQLRKCDQWAYWTGFDWHELRHAPVPSVRKMMLDVRPKPAGLTMADYIKQGYIQPSLSPRWECPATPWTGEGLPPIGLDVEVLYNSANAQYVTAKVLAHDEEKALYRFTSGSRKGEYESDKGGLFDGRLPLFRPIRRPEQIAAEEREAALDEMTDCASFLYASAATRRAIAGELYDAGYRKFEIVEEKS